MVIFRVVVDEGWCKDQVDLVMLSFRILVYDVEIRSFCYFKFIFKVCFKFFMFNFSFSSFKVVKDQLGDVCYLGQCYSGVGLGNLERIDCF